MLASFINKIIKTFFILNHLPNAASMKNRSNYWSMLEKAHHSVGYSVASGSMSIGTCSRDRDRKLYLTILRLKMASIHIRVKRKQKNEVLHFSKFVRSLASTRTRRCCATARASQYSSVWEEHWRILHLHKNASLRNVVYGASFIPLHACCCDSEVRG